MAAAAAAVLLQMPHTRLLLSRDRSFGVRGENSNFLECISSLRDPAMESVNYKKKNKEKIIKAALSHGKERVE